MLRLMIEIPNAGGRGRRIVTSVAGPGTPTDFLAPGRTGPEGGDFIAVQWRMTQKLEKGTVRDDDERLILIGVDTLQLTVNEREQVRDSLRQLRSEIEPVLGSIDWDSPSHGTAVVAAPLADLLGRPPFSDLPLLRDPHPVQPLGGKSKRPSAKLSRQLASIAACAAGLMAVAFWWSQHEVVPQPSPSPPGPEQMMGQVSQAMRCSQEDLRRWVAAAHGLAEEDAGPTIESNTLQRLSETTGIARYFIFDPTPAEQSQLPEFIECVVPATAADCADARVTLREAHNHLAALHSAAVRASRVRDWRQTLESTSTDRLAMDAVDVAFIASLVSFGRDSLASTGSTTEPSGPFFGADDHRRFADLAQFFSPERRAPIGNVTRITYTSDKQSTALCAAVNTMPPTNTELARLTDVGDRAYGRTDCKDLQSVVTHFNELCRTLGRLPRALTHP